MSICRWCGSKVSAKRLPGQLSVYHPSCIEQKQRLRTFRPSESNDPISKTVATTEHALDLIAWQKRADESYARITKRFSDRTRA